MPYDHDVLAELDEQLDALESPTVEEVYDAALPYEAGMVAASAVRRALAGGGGGGAQVFVQDTDPGAVGAGAIWVNTTSPGFIPDGVRPALVRNATDDGWLEQGLVHFDGDGNLRSFVTLSDGAAVIEKLNADGDPMSMLILRDDVVYLSGNGVPIWLDGSAGGGTAWGISATGLERFGPGSEPADDETGFHSGFGRVHYYDNTSGAPALRFKQADADGTITTGKSASMTDDGTSFKGVAKPSVAAATAPAILAALVTLGLVTDDS